MRAHVAVEGAEAHCLPEVQKLPVAKTVVATEGKLSMSSKLFFGGVPTDPDIHQLRKKVARQLSQ